MAAKDPLLKQMGEYLRSVRENVGWSQEDLAYECGLHRTYVGSVERGEYNITILNLRKITNALGISLTDAVGAAIRRTGKRA